MGTKWDNFLKNLGEWRGSFTKVSLEGNLQDSTPTILNLEGFENNRLVKFRVRRFGMGDDAAPSQDIQKEYRSLGREMIVFETGAFSKGSIQLAPFSTFGAEFGFVTTGRRLRFVQLFNEQGQVDSLTLIRELRHGSNTPERPPLRLEHLLGVWEGTACTIEADWQEPVYRPTRLELVQLKSDRLQQRIFFDQQEIESTARINGQQLLFEDSSQTRIVTLTADGASSHVPVQLPRHQPFFVEVGWLVSPNERQRLIRHYDAKGGWCAATHVIEYRSTG